MRFKTLIFVALLTGLAVLAQADTRLRLILIDDSVLRGTLVSNDSQVLTLNVNGQTKKVPVDGVKKAFDDSTGKPFDLASTAVQSMPENNSDLSSADDGDDQAEQAPVRRHRRRLARVRPEPTQLHLRSNHEWFDLDFNWQVGALIGDDSSLKSFWNQNAPGLSYDNDSNHLAMAFDFDALVRPLPWFAIGPFLTWNYFAPGADGTGIDSGTGDSFREEMDFGNVAYGARAKIIFPIKNAQNMESARASLEFSAGQLSLSNASFNTWDEGTLAQQVDLDGTAPFFGASANFDAVLVRDFALEMGLGFQAARMNEVHYYVNQDDLNIPSLAGQSGTLTDGSGNDLFVDFTNIYFKMAMTFMF